MRLANGRAMARGVLAGSVLTLDRALPNLMEYTGAPLLDALRLVTVNPAAMIGLEGEVGSLRVGQVANIVAVNAAGRLVASIVGGQLAASL